jgi:hypothetical protein
MGDELLKIFSGLNVLVFKGKVDFLEEETQGV